MKTRPFRPILLVVALALTLLPGFPVEAQPAPTLASVTPGGGPTNGGTVVTIVGTGFLSGATVAFGGQPASSVTVNSLSNITAVTPSVPSPESVNVTVTNEGGKTAVLTNGFAYGWPGILTKPTVQIVLGGGTATFSVTAIGSGLLTYQWQFNGTNLPYSYLNGLISTVAGNGTQGFAGDNGPATNAELSFPAAVTLDASGNLFIADAGNSRIRKLGTNGTITTVAGDGTQGFSGDGGLATSAELNYPAGVAVNAAGNLFIGDFNNDRIRKVSPSALIPTAMITTFAGNGTGGFSGEGGLATNAELYAPAGVAADAFGNLFIADSANFRIREVRTNGTIITVAGNGFQGVGGNGEAAIFAELGYVFGVAVDAFGNVFIADDNSSIRKVATNGIINIVAGFGYSGYSGDGGPATSAELAAPHNVAVDAYGNLFIADTGNNRIRIAGTNGIINTAAGDGTGGFSGDGGAATNAELSSPTAVAVDALGNVFIADEGNNRIRRVFQSPTLVLKNVGAANAGSYDVVVSNPYGAVTSSVVALQVLLPPTIVTAPQSLAAVVGSNATMSVTASGTAPFAYQWYFDGTPIQNQTNVTLLLSNVAFTNAGSYNVVVTNLYGAVTSAVAVLSAGIPPGITALTRSQTNLLDSSASFSASVSGTGPFSFQWQFDGTNLPGIVTVAGDGTGGYSGDGEEATAAELDYPAGVALDPSGNLFLVDAGNERIRKVGTNGTIITVAGNGTNGYSGDGGQATNAEFNSPYGVAVDVSGNLFISDSGNFCIRKVGASGIITTVAGDGTPGYFGDGGAATNAQLYYPLGVAVDAVGNLFIADSYNYCVRKVGTNGIINTVAGNGIQGYYGDGGEATNAELQICYSVAVDALGDMFIADTFNNRIREVGTNGIITTVAGNGTDGYSGDGGAATNAQLSNPSTVAVDASGNLFIADESNNRIREVGTNGIIITVAGNGTNGYSGDGGPATNAELRYPVGVAVDASGNLFIGDDDNNRIRKVFRSLALILNNLSGGNAGSYDLVVSSPYGSFTSSIVTLTVVLNPLEALLVKGQVQLQFQGNAGNSYVLLSATNLIPPVDWLPIVTNSAATNGNWSFTMTNVLPNTARFYRMSTAGP